jgi:hypothetical protein
MWKEIRFRLGIAELMQDSVRGLRRSFMPVENLLDGRRQEGPEGLSHLRSRSIDREADESVDEG